MTPEGYLRDLARTLSGPAPAEPSLPLEGSDAEAFQADLPRVQQALEGRDIDEVFPHLSSLSASFHGRGLRETVEKLGLRADVRWGCEGLPLETLDVLALQVPFGGGVAIGMPSGLVKFVATLAHAVAQVVPLPATGLAPAGPPPEPPDLPDLSAGPTPADIELVDLLVATATPGGRVKAVVPCQDDPAAPLAGILRNVAERFALACAAAVAVLEPPRLPLWVTTRLGEGVEVKRLLPEAKEIMAADIVATRLTVDVPWNDHPGLAVWGIDLYLGSLVLVESLQGRPRNAERGFIPALARRNLVRTILKQAAGEEAERAFEWADVGAHALALLWERNRETIEARLPSR